MDEVASVQKQCVMCGEIKFVSHFYKNSKGRPNSYCKLCDHARYRERYKISGKSEEKQKRERNLHLKRAFNLDEEEYDALIEAQGGICACCGNKETLLDPRSNRPRKLAIDHCHVTGRVRALLCAACNTAFGLLNEDPFRIEALLRYAQAQKAVTVRLDEN